MIFKRLIWIMMLFIIVISSSYVFASLNDGVFSYYNFSSDGNDYFGLNNFTTNAVDFVGAKVGNGIRFDALNDYGRNTPIVPFNYSTTGLTICGWFNSTDASTNYQRVLFMKQSSVNSFSGLQIRTDHGNAYTFVKNLNGVGADDSTTGIVRGNTSFVFMCGIFNNSGIFAYINNATLIEADTTYLGGSHPINMLDIGQNRDATAEQFLGMIDELIFYNRTLDIPEISGIYYNNTLGIAYPFLQDYIPPSTTISNVCNMNLTYSENIDTQINLTWNASTGTNIFYVPYIVNPFGYNDSLNYIEYSNTTDLNYSVSLQDIITSIGEYTAYRIDIDACDNTTCNETRNDSEVCPFYVCYNNYQKVVQPCVSNTKLIVYTDVNECGLQLDFPVTNGTYEDCIDIVYSQKTYTDDMIILIVLAFFIVICLICAIFVHEGFFGLTALMFSLMLYTFLHYDYPQILVYAIVFIILLLIIMWIVIRKMRK